MLRPVVPGRLEKLTANGTGGEVFGVNVDVKARCVALDVRQQRLVEPENTAARRPWIPIRWRNERDDDIAIDTGRCLVDVRQGGFVDTIDGDAEAERCSADDHGRRSVTVRMPSIRITGLRDLVASQQDGEQRRHRCLDRCCPSPEAICCATTAELPSIKTPARPA